MWPLCLRSESRRRAACRLNAAQAPDFTYSCQASTEHFEQCAEFALLCNRGLGPLAVTVLPIPLARRGTATSCAAVQSTAPFFRRWRPAWPPALRPRSALTGCLKLHGCWLPRRSYHLPGPATVALKLAVDDVVLEVLRPSRANHIIDRLRTGT